MRRIVIVAKSYRDTSGGRLALHRLCDVLLRNGVDAAMYPWKEPNGFAVCTRYVSAVTDRVEPDDIVLYPDIVPGNPLSAKRFARWMLYHPRYPLNGTDLVYWFNPIFGKPPHLYVTDARLDLFNSYGLESRTGLCWTWRKAHKQGWTDKDRPKHGLELTKGVPSEELSRVFNTKELFLCFDNATFMAVQARLCGCRVSIRSRTPVAPWLADQMEMTPLELAAWYRSEEVKQASEVLAVVDELQKRFE